MCKNIELCNKIEHADGAVSSSSKMWWPISYVQVMCTITLFPIICLLELYWWLLNLWAHSSVIRADHTGSGFIILEPEATRTDQSSPSSWGPQLVPNICPGCCLSSYLQALLPYSWRLLEHYTAWNKYLQKAVEGTAYCFLSGFKKSFNLNFYYIFIYQKGSNVYSEKETTTVLNWCCSTDVCPSFLFSFFQMII